jgi:hypothetical protein
MDENCHRLDSEAIRHTWSFQIIPLPTLLLLPGLAVVNIVPFQYPEIHRDLAFGRSVVRFKFTSYNGREGPSLVSNKVHELAKASNGA